MLARHFKKGLALSKPGLSTVGLLNTSKRGNFSFLDRVKEKINNPIRHLQSFIEPDG
jgi:hypothetical protein